MAYPMRVPNQEAHRMIKCLLVNWYGQLNRNRPKISRCLVVFLIKPLLNSKKWLQQCLLLLGYYWHITKTLPKHNQNITKTLLKYKQHTSKTLQKHYQNTIPEHCQNITKTLAKHYQNTAKTLQKHYQNTLLKHCQNTT